MVSYGIEVSKVSFQCLVPKRCLVERLLLLLFLMEMRKCTCHLGPPFSKAPSSSLKNDTYVLLSRGRSHFPLLRSVRITGGGVGFFFKLLLFYLLDLVLLGLCLPFFLDDSWLTAVSALDLSELVTFILLNLTTYCIFSTETTVPLACSKVFYTDREEEVLASSDSLAERSWAWQGWVVISFPLRTKHQGFSDPLVSSYTTKLYVEVLCPPQHCTLPAAGVTRLWEATHRTLACWTNGYFLLNLEMPVLLEMGDFSILLLGMKVMIQSDGQTVLLGIKW